MFRKMTLLAAAVMILIYPQNVSAIQNSEAFILCADKEASDSGMTKCYQNEIKYFEGIIKDNIKKIKEWDVFDKLTQNKEYDLDSQYKNLKTFTDDYCEYYVKAKQNNGYSDAYLEAECRLGFIHMYAGSLSGIITFAGSLCDPDE